MLMIIPALAAGAAGLAGGAGALGGLSGALGSAGKSLLPALMTILKGSSFQAQGKGFNVGVGGESEVDRLIKQLVQNQSQGLRTLQNPDGQAPNPQPTTTPNRGPVNIAPPGLGPTFPQPNFIGPPAPGFGLR